MPRCASCVCALLLRARFQLTIALLMHRHVASITEAIAVRADAADDIRLFLLLLLLLLLLHGQKLLLLQLVLLEIEHLLTLLL